jgi:Adenylate and Guanylate cyclase catalytic domain
MSTLGFCSTIHPLGSRSNLCIDAASRMESTGERGKIQISESTAALLREQGKEYWLQPRTDAVKVSWVDDVLMCWLCDLC